VDTGADPTDTGDPSDTGGGDGPDGSIGDPVGDPVAIDHASALNTVVDNLTRHIDGLDNALAFLETSDSVGNLVDMLFGDDDEEDEDHEDEGAEDDEDEADEDEGLDIDLSELRDDLIGFLKDEVMVEATSTVAEDGMSITYLLSPEYFCVSEVEEDESMEDEAERLEDDAECAERITENPIRIGLMSDGEGDMNLSLLVGEDRVESIRMQVYDDMMSVVVELPNITPLVEVFVDPEDFELPSTMEGTFGGEIREESTLNYTARFAMPDGIHVVPDADQEQYSLEISDEPTPGAITIDGSGETLSGSLDMGELQAALPWQMIVDMFYDDEGYSEWMCETDEATGMEECWEEWVEAPEPPEVEGRFIIDIPGVTGSVDYSADDDTFHLMGMGLGDGSTVVKVDADTILSIDLNPDHGRSLDLSVSGNEDGDIGLEFAPVLDAQATFEWHKVSEVIEDMSSFMMDETIGIRFDDSDAPTLDILREDDTEMRVTSGRLTMWSTEMMEDVVIEEGECITSVDDESLSEEEEEAQHDLFGGMMGATCEA